MVAHSSLFRVYKLFAIYYALPVVIQIIVELPLQIFLDTYWINLLSLNCRPQILRNFDNRCFSFQNFYELPFTGSLRQPRTDPVEGIAEIGPTYNASSGPKSKGKGEMPTEKRTDHSVSPR